MYEVGKKLSVSSKETVEDVKKYKCLRVPDHVPLEAAEFFGVRSAVSEKDGKTVEATYFPYYSQENKLVGYKKRDWTLDKSEKGHFTAIGTVNPQCKLFGQHKFGEGAKKILFVEGEGDLCVSWYALNEFITGKGFNQSYAIVSLPSGCGNAKAAAIANEKFLLNCEELIFGFDNDERLQGEKKNVMRGKEAKEAVFAALMSPKIKEILWPEGHKDARDYATECLREKKLKEFYDLCLFRTKRMSASKIIQPHDVTFEEMEAPIPEGVYIKTFPKLMEKFRGIRKKEITLLTAPSGAGKTTVASVIMGELAEEEQKIGVIFLEEESLDTLKRMQAFRLRKPFDHLFFKPDEITTIDERREAWDWVKAQNEDGSSKRFVLLDHFGSIDTQDLMDKIKYLIYIEKCDYIVLDHISIVVSGSESDNERKDIDILMTNLAQLVAAEECTAGIIPISHINRTGSAASGPKKGKEDEPYWIEVKKESLRGSSAIEGLCWNIIGVEPEILPDRSRGRVRLVALKNRKAKQLGVADVLRMNEDTGLLVDASDKMEADF